MPHSPELLGDRGCSLLQVPDPPADPGSAVTAGPTLEAASVIRAPDRTRPRRSHRLGTVPTAPSIPGASQPHKVGAGPFPLPSTSVALPGTGLSTTEMRPQDLGLLHACRWNKAQKTPSRDLAPPVPDLWRPPVFPYGQGPERRKALLKAEETAGAAPALPTPCPLWTGHFQLPCVFKSCLPASSPAGLWGKPGPQEPEEVGCLIPARLLGPWKSPPLPRERSWGYVYIKGHQTPSYACGSLVLTFSPIVNTSLKKIQ